MTDPIKKYEELKNLTEGIFNKIYTALKSPPSATLPSHKSAQNAKKYQQMYGVHYIIKGFSKNKYYDASDLINLYKNGQIKNDTPIKILNSKKSFFPFINLLKREPFSSSLKDYFKQSNENPDANTSYSIAVLKRPVGKKPYYATQKSTIPQIADMIVANPGLENILDIYNSDKSTYIPIKSSEIWPRIESLVNHFRAHP
jgi:hypothetical protein